MRYVCVYVFVIEFKIRSFRLSNVWVISELVAMNKHGGVGLTIETIMKATEIASKHAASLHEVLNKVWLLFPRFNTIIIRPIICNFSLLISSRSQLLGSVAVGGAGTGRAGRTNGSYEKVSTVTAIYENSK